MWEILHNHWTDYIIHSSNWKIYKIQEDQLLNFAKYINYENSLTFSQDEIYNNDIYSCFDELYNGKFNLEYADLHFWKEVIVFDYRTFIWNESNKITPYLIEECYKNNKNETIQAEFDLVDTKNDKYYNFWTYEFHFWYEWAWLLSPEYFNLSVNTYINFNTDEFVKWFSNNYLWATINWEKEEFIYVEKLTNTI